MTHQESVSDFHERFGVRTATKSNPVPLDAYLRVRLIAEEFCELCQAMGMSEFADQLRAISDEARSVHEAGGTAPPADLYQMAEIADALVDLDYVVQGTLDVFGIDGDLLFEDVHEANILKEPAGADGKIRKPEGWEPPNIEMALARQVIMAVATEKAGEEIDAILNQEPDEAAPAPLKEALVILAQQKDEV